MKLLVCGSRTWRDAVVIGSELERFAHLKPLVIHGGAPGADTIAGDVARQLGLEVQVFMADWRLGKSAGPIRNRAMLDEGPDRVLAFQAGPSPGTVDTIAEARRRGIPVEVFGGGAALDEQTTLSFD